MANENNTNMKYTEPTNTNTFTLKNFRSFDAEGAEFQISPITILTGCNSAGKSSLVKAMMMLSDYLKESQNGCLIKTDDANGKNKFGVKLNYIQNPNAVKLDFVRTDSKYRLGRFDCVLNRNAEKGDAIELSYSYYSKILSQQITASFSFKGVSDDNFNNGTLSKMVLSNEDGIRIWSYDSVDNGSLNWGILKKPMCKFYLDLIRMKTIKTVRHAKSDAQEKEALNILEKCQELVKKLGISEKEETGHYEVQQINDLWCPAIDELNYVLNDGSWIVIPALDPLESLKKTDVRGFLEDRYKGILANNVKAADLLNYILEDFEKSDEENFLSFLKYLQNKINYVDTRWVDEVDEYYVFDPCNVFHDCYRTKEQDGARLTRNEYMEKMMPEDIIMSMIFFESRIDSTGDCYRFNVFAEIQYNSYCYLQKEAISSSFLYTETRYVPSDCLKAKRLYSLDNHEDPLSALLVEHYNSRLEHDRHLINLKSAKDIRKFSKKWLREFGIAENFSIENTADGLGITIKLLKDGEWTLLADEGYGITQFIFLLLQIETLAFRVKTQGSEGGLWDAYHIEPRYCEKESIQLALENHRTYSLCPSIIAIEEPENHLHPAFQSKLAELFLDAFEQFQINFVVETHSEYLIRKFQVLISDKGNGFDNFNIAIHYAGNDGCGNTKCTHINVKEDGRLSEPFGPGFFDEADNLAFQLLENKVSDE